MSNPTNPAVPLPGEQPTATVQQPTPSAPPNQPTPPQVTPAAGGDQLGEGGVKALQAERDARQAAETERKALQKQLDDLTAQLATATAAADTRTDLEKQVEAMQTQLDGETAARKVAEENAAKATLAQLRSDRASAKGLPAALAKKLTGTTAAELDTEIDELLPFLTQSRTPGYVPGEGGVVGGGSGDPAQQFAELIRNARH